jgi:hypothetical protein
MSNQRAQNNRLTMKPTKTGMLILLQLAGAAAFLVVWYSSSISLVSPSDLPSLTYMLVGFTASYECSESEKLAPGMVEMNVSLPVPKLNSEDDIGRLFVEQAEPKTRLTISLGTSEDNKWPVAMGGSDPTISPTRSIPAEFSGDILSLREVIPADGWSYLEVRPSVQITPEMCAAVQKAETLERRPIREYIDVYISAFVKARQMPKYAILPWPLTTDRCFPKRILMTGCYAPGLSYSLAEINQKRKLTWQNNSLPMLASGKYSTKSGSKQVSAKGEIELGANIVFKNYTSKFVLDKNSLLSADISLYDDIYAQESWPIMRIWLVTAILLAVTLGAMLKWSRGFPATRLSQVVASFVHVAYFTALATQIALFFFGGNFLSFRNLYFDAIFIGPGLGLFVLFFLGGRKKAFLYGLTLPIAFAAVALPTLHLFTASMLSPELILQSIMVGLTENMLAKGVLWALLIVASYVIPILCGIWAIRIWDKANRNPTGA